MTRYQILYDKGADPIVQWKDAKQEALEEAEKLRNEGYHVDIWEHSDTGATPIVLSDISLEKIDENRKKNIDIDPNTLV